MGCDYSLKLNYGVISLMCCGTISLKISGISRNKPQNKQPANAEINPQLVEKQAQCRGKSARLATLYDIQVPPNYLIEARFFGILYKGSQAYMGYGDNVCKNVLFIQWNEQMIAV